MALFSEKLHQGLEEKLEKLQKTLKYWQTWEAEYESCKEEISELNDATAEQMVEIGADYDGEFVNESEIKSIVDYGKTPTRTKTQVVGLLSRRAETGRKNLEVVQRQLEKVEDELSETLSSGVSNVGNETGSRMMEITEELDDDDHVISSNVSDFNQEMNQIQRVLKNGSQALNQEKASQSPDSDSSLKASNPSISTTSQTSSTTLVNTSSRSSAATESIKSKQTDLNSKDLEGQSLRSLMAGQSPYSEAYDNLNELNPIVATMNIEEYSGSDEDIDSDEYASENEYGMNNVNDEISEDYIKEMEALIRKHTMTNIGGSESQNKQSSIETLSPSKPSLRSTTISETSQSQPTKQKDKKEKKGVKFAENLDIARDTLESSRNGTAIAQEPEKPEVAPMAEVVVERISAPASAVSSVVNTPKKSRFKASKSGLSNSSNLDRRECPGSPSALPDELTFKDELKLYKERMGKPQQQVDRSLFQEEDQQPKPSERLSKFKAARMGVRQEDA